MLKRRVRSAPPSTSQQQQKQLGLSLQLAMDLIHDSPKKHQPLVLYPHFLPIETKTIPPSHRVVVVVVIIINDHLMALAGMGHFLRLASLAPPCADEYVRVDNFMIIWDLNYALVTI